MVGHEGGDNNGDFAPSLTVTDIQTGWTEVRTVRNKAARHSFAALVEIQPALPFPLLGTDSATAASSSAITCCAVAAPSRSPSPGPGRRTRTTALYQTYVMLHPPQPEPLPAPQVTVNVTVDSDEIAQKVAKRLQDEGIRVTTEPSDGETKPHK